MTRALAALTVLNGTFALTTLLASGALTASAHAARAPSALTISRLEVVDKGGKVRLILSGDDGSLEIRSSDGRRQTLLHVEDRWQGWTMRGESGVNMLGLSENDGRVAVGLQNPQGATRTMLFVGPEGAGLDLRDPAGKQTARLVANEAQAYLEFNLKEAATLGVTRSGDSARVEALDDTKGCSMETCDRGR